MTLEALGEAAALGFKHIAEIERGQKAPSFEAIDRLAGALGIRVFELFLPLGIKDVELDRSLKILMREVEGESSAGMKRFVFVLLSLLRQLESERPDEMKSAVLESKNPHDLLGSVTILGEVSAVRPSS
jgi:transcriptional regulator with XRE-family HTH domain